MTFEEIFKKLKEIFMGADISGIDKNLAFQFNIKGEGEGIFYVEIKDGIISVEPYEYHNRDAMFTATAENYLKLASGKLNPMISYTMGKLKVEGDLGKALEIQKLLKA